jgi:predicted ATPase
MTLASKPYLQTVSIRPDAEIDFDVYPFTIPAVRELGHLELHPDVTFFVGENGAGKSTVEVLRLARSFRKPRDGYFLRAESFYNVATFMDETGYLGGYGNKSLHARSHGEAFMTLLTQKFSGRGLYLMDEPEAALSPNRQLAALTAIHQLVQDESQFIIATHSPILLSYPRAKILQFDGSGITEVAFEDTEHYAVTRDFLNNYPRRLEQLLADE